MSKFSDRIGVTQPPRTIQVSSMDDALRTGLWNWLCYVFEMPPGGSLTRGTSDQYWHQAARMGMWDAFFHLPVDEIPQSPQAQVKKWFMNCEWYEAYNFIEYVLPPRITNFRGDSHGRTSAGFIDRLNRVLERELSGYRVINALLVPVTSPGEISEIERAGTPRTGFEGVADHINTALALLGKKPDPDYRNSVKESISAVEAAAKLLTGEKSGGIDTALAILDKKYGLHPAFRIALSKLYAYTCDEDGIRHCTLDEATVSEAESRFMLVVCSAFANWLLSTADGKTR